MRYTNTRLLYVTFTDINKLQPQTSIKTSCNTGIILRHDVSVMFFSCQLWKRQQIVYTDVPHWRDTTFNIRLRITRSSVVVSPRRQHTEIYDIYRWNYQPLSLLQWDELCDKYWKRKLFQNRMAITSSIINGFSNIFHCSKDKQITNKTHLMFPTTPSVCCRTTFQKLEVQNCGNFPPPKKI